MAPDNTRPLQINKTTPGLTAALFNRPHQPASYKQPLTRPGQVDDDGYVLLVDPARLANRLKDDMHIERRRITERLFRLGQPKQLVFAQPSHLSDLALLATRAPNLRLFIDALQLRIKAQIIGKQPISLGRPLLLGEPGNGKSFLMQQLGELFGLPVEEFQLGGSGDMLALTGTSRGWGNCTPGRIVTALADSAIANPIFLFEEIDKAGRTHWGNLHDVLLMLLEPQNARTFEDKFLGMPCDVSWSSFVSSANTIDELPAPLLSRLQRSDIPPPKPAQWPAIVNILYQKLIKEKGLADCFIDEWPAETRGALLTNCTSIRLLRERIDQGIDLALRDLDVGHFQEPPCQELQNKIIPLVPTTPHTGKCGIGFLSTMQVE